ncbi:MAG: DDE-type integrase/transposase/recombinase, partial [Candidatus Heimdallarchaeota archaeon]|nr:DDE-type integrase/transposase/recombinase [Candidatus Heimdallarchaeota archaeon]
MDCTEFASHPLGQPVFRFELVDDCTNARLSTTLCLSASAEEAVAAVRAAIERFGVPERLHSDRGTQFVGARSGAPTQLFAALAADYPGLTFSYARPGRPHENGKA